MNCEQSIELLPWLLNGTLGEDERREVQGHLATCESCREALAGTRDAWELFAQHIPAAALIAQAAGETPEGLDPALLAEHLATCPECAAELELVRTSRGLVEDDAVALFPARPPAPPFDQRGTSANPPISRPAPVRPPVVRWRAAALAAGLTGLVALGGWYKSAEQARTLDSRLAAASAPTLAVPSQAPPPIASPGARPAADAERDHQIADLERRLAQTTQLAAKLAEQESQVRGQVAQREPAAGPLVNTWSDTVLESGDVVRGANDDAKVVPAGAPLATLSLHAGEAQGDRDLEVLDAGGRVALKAQGLHFDPDGHNYTVSLPRGTLKPGAYTLRLYRRDGRDGRVGRDARDGGRRTAAESYAIVLK